MEKRFHELWANWDAMKPAERKARRLALKDAPERSNEIVKSWVDEWYRYYMKICMLEGVPKWRLDLIFDYVYSFHAGLAFVKDHDGDSEEGEEGKKGKWFLIYPDGTPADDERYDNALPLRHNRYQVEKDGEEFNLFPDGTRVKGKASDSKLQDSETPDAKTAKC